ncbi:hypothetical protein FS837_000571 [Tulasnella sp. UAMH 9824]|nr:hypothetical protein FS837_000571 [Tulasnella sp. UAMH 9824]
MASAGKFLNAPAAQTDALAEQATSPPATVDSNKRLSALQNYRAFLDPIAALPFELMEIIFQLALPSLDIMIWDWDIRAYHPYMATLYGLRCVSKMWKNMVDGMPSLWTIICASFPENVIRTSLVRSGSSPLVIYFPGPRARRSITPAFREFFPIIEEHLHRCRSLAWWTDSELVDCVPSLSPLRLVALKIRIDVDSIWFPRDVIPFAREIEISDEALENIRALDLTRAPMDWARTLEHLRGLRTLALTGVYDNTITIEQILSALVSSPSIEALTISDIEIGDPLSPPMEPIFFPHLRSITLHADGALTNALLRRIGPSSEITELDIRPTGLPSLVPTSSWHETMVPWIPVVQRLCQNSSGPTVHLAHRTGCRLQSNSEYHLVIDFLNLSQAAALRWIQDAIISDRDVENGGLQLLVNGAAFESAGVLEIIQTMWGITGIIASPVNRLFGPSLEALLDVLGQATTDSAGTPTPKSTFPTLQKLVFHSWILKFDSITDMLKKRYSMRSLYRQQIPDLTLDLSILRPWFQPGRDRTIISFPDAKALRELDGVKEVRMGCVLKQPGILAVIWDEEKSLPAWG